MVIYFGTLTASPHPLTESSVARSSPSQPTGANRSTHRPGPVAVTWPVRVTDSPSGLTWARARHRASGEGVGRRG